MSRTSARMSASVVITMLSLRRPLRDGASLSGCPQVALSAAAAANPDRVFTPAPRRAVEPAVDGIDREALAAQELLPLRHGEPREREDGLDALASHAQDERLALLVPVGPFEDPRLALEP